MRIHIFLLCFFFALNANSQRADSLKSWRLNSLYGLNGSQSSFVNWSAGGTNNISVTGFIASSANFSKGPISWSNDLSLALGGVLYLSADASQPIQKTDDRIELSSKVGYKIGKQYDISLINTFRTQFIDGFSDPALANRSSKFMAPGYLNIALGVEYKPSKNFSLFLSPVSSKLTFVQDFSLANAGAFGVDPAVYDQTTGLLVAPGSQLRTEFGAFLKMTYNKKLAPNIELRTKLDLFSNYLEKPQNIDVNADVFLRFKINGWLSTSLNWTLIYDDDIMITDNKGGVGPRTQFKSVLGLGISYSMKNYSDPKPKSKK